MKLVTKACKRCGNIMVNVQSARRFCDDCNRLKNNESAKASYHKNKDRLNEKKREKRHKEKSKKIKVVKSIELCNREARALGLTYGQYVERGLDKEVL